jgi:L-asparaginase II
LVGYLEPEHPLQVAIREHLREVLQLDQEEPFPVAVDGCSAPTYALPLEALARGYAALADPEATALDRERSQALLKLRDAMGGYPEWVAGPGRFTTELIRATGGRILGKEGAEGVYALANRGPMPWGAALKIADGSERARDTIVLALLEELGALSFGERRALESQFLRPVQNHRGMEVGSIEPLFELEWAADFRSKVVSSSGEERGH